MVNLLAEIKHKCLTKTLKPKSLTKSQTPSNSPKLNPKAIHAMSLAEKVSEFAYLTSKKSKRICILDK